MLYENYAGIGKINKPLVDFLSSKRKVLKYGVISSTDYNLKKILEKDNLLDLFDIVLTTGETGMDKKQPEIYQKAITMLGIDSSQIIFIDNEQQYIDAGKSIGMNSILYTNFLDCEKELIKFGL